MDILTFILYPIVWVMMQVLVFYQSILSSMGVSIILLSFTFSLLLLPLQRYGRRVEDRLSGKVQQINAEINPLKQSLKGEALFLETEKIYKKYNYHPIHNVGMGASFFVMLPVLLSVILLFSGEGILSSESFLMIDDLSQSDGLLGSLNMMPLLMIAVSLVDANLRFKDDKRSRYRFYFISLVLLIIVYNLAAGIILYWTGSNIMSLVLSRLSSR